jgi:acylphosphatase
MICLRCVVSGRVQGVFFRESTRQQAESLGVTGSAVNLPDGRVEILACGEDAAVRALVDWLWEGPRLAEVEDVQVEEATLQGIPERFSTH